MIKAHVIGEYVPTDGLLLPSPNSRYGVKTEDVTGQPSADILAGLDPNATIFEITADVETFAQIENDADLYVLWSMEL